MPTLAPITITRPTDDSVPSDRLYIVLEGGGAKGIAHIGFLYALKAILKEKPIKISAVAGASIGAVIASLIAAGAEPEDLLDLNDQTSPLRRQLHLNRIIDIIGPSGWRRMEIFRFIRHRPLPSLMLFFLSIVCFSLVAHRGAKLSYINPGLPWLHIGLAFLVALSLYLPWKIISAVAVKFRKGMRNERTSGHRAFLFSTLLGIVSFIWLHTILWYSSFTYRFTFSDPPVAEVAFLERLSFFAFIFLFASATVLYIRRFLKGLIGTTPIREALNAALALLVAKQPDGGIDEERRAKLGREGVKFGDLRLPLRVVAADVIGNRLRVFDELDVNTPVADAVVASLSIPFLFRPKYLDDTIYVDGGIVSNIPAWVFRPERLVEPDATILAVGIAAEPPDSWIVSFLQNSGRFGSHHSGTKGEIIREYLKTREKRFWHPLMWQPLRMLWPFQLASNIIYTGLFGGRELEYAGDGIKVLQLQPQGVKLLDFDIDEEQGRLRSLMQSWISHAEEEMRHHFIELPKHAVGLGKKIDTLFMNRIDAIGRGDVDLISRISDQKLGDGTHVPGKIRILIAKLNDTRTFLSRLTSYNYDGDLDDKLIFPLNSSLLGRCSRDNKTYFARRANIEQAYAEGGIHGQNRFATKWRWLRWCWVMPLDLGEAGTIAPYVLCIESNIPMARIGYGLGQEARERDDAMEWKTGLRVEAPEMRVLESFIRQQGLEYLKNAKLL